MDDHHEDDELTPTQTTGYKPGEKKSLQEYQDLDAQDESLNKWKESLGLKNTPATSSSGDTRNVVVEHIALEVEGRPDVIVDLSTPDAVDKSRSIPFTIKEGVEYRMKVKFR
ncbi:hypothetical protein G6F56_013635 [Rhizopus delemar]|nr:hypothetical protein G6F56_013635 [Rhizopus delemar]